jgi:phenylalanyl-tRNA synthetase beta chain
VDIFDAKANAEAVLFALKSPLKLNVHRDVSDWWHPGRSGRLALGAKKTLGTFGEIHPRLIKEFGLRGAVVAFTILLENIPERRSKATTRDALKISDLQGVERDFAFILNSEIDSHIVVSAAQSADKELIESVNVFDEFKGPQAEAQFGKGKKSLAISVKLQPKEITFKDADIEAISLKIIAGVIASTRGELRK